MKPILAITCGDTNGVGPELALRASLHPVCRRTCLPVLVGPPAVFQFYASALRIRASFRDWDGSRVTLRRTPHRDIPVFASSELLANEISPGSPTSHGGLAAGHALEAAVRLHARSAVDAIVTAPLSKKALHLAGYDFPGQTEMLQALTSSRDVGMMLVSPLMRIGLLTIHIPLRRVPPEITEALIVQKVTLFHEALRKDWRVKRPHIALLGLNPHAGEDGEIGLEEQEIMIPALQGLRRTGIRCDGPFAADGFFARYDPRTWDAVVAPYHDQGLIAVKQTARGRVVNVSIGLPLVRTSPGHGTAMDIAGKGIADPAGMVEAVKTALFLSKNRRYAARAL
jgi:4-hydroxythreonine-4-phosphate dehydrogenase